MLRQPFHILATSLLRNSDINNSIIYHQPTMTPLHQRTSTSHMNEEFPIMYDTTVISSQSKETVDSESAAFPSLSAQSLSSMRKTSSGLSLSSLRLPATRSAPKLKINFRRSESEDSLCKTSHPKRKSYRLRQKSCLKHLNDNGCTSNPFLLERK
mmetsp:Transcript_22632/g.54661  ORF Transcript_22632/g.54661 Transcript_22632/m.54661 type:complete len:155 (+) Transcript_22632:74-538(+)